MQRFGGEERGAGGARAADGANTAISTAHGGYAKERLGPDCHSWPVSAQFCAARRSSTSDSDSSQPYLRCGGEGSGSSRDRTQIRALEGRGRGHEAMVLVLAAPIGLSPVHILTLCGSKRVLVVSTEPPNDLSCLTTSGVGRSRDGLLPVPLTRCIQMHTPSPCGVTFFFRGGGSGVGGPAPPPPPPSGAEFLV